MRATVLFVLLAALSSPVLAQEKPVQAFDGTGALTTHTFQVPDKWEVRWDSPDVLSLTLLAPDGTIVAGVASSLKGSLYQPKGGTYYLQINRAANATTPWHISVTQIDVSATASTADSNYLPPQTIPPPDGGNAVATSTPPLPSTAARTADSATNAPLSTPATSGLTDDQSHAVVVIKGDVGQGTGFLIHSPDGPTVVTNLHVISANPNIKIMTTNGQQIQMLGLKGASDRDLAMFLIRDNHYTYFDPATDIKDTVEEGDDVITPGNSEGGEVVLNTKGHVLGIGPERIEINNPIFHGNSGGPVFHVKSGKVLAVVTMGQKVKPTDDLDKASYANSNSAIVGSMRYFALRLDTVPQWEPYDWNRFLGETMFLKNFHEKSRALDSFLNGAQYERANLATATDEGPPDSHYYLRDDKIVKAKDSYHKSSADADQSQKLDAVRVLILDLDGIADGNMTAIQNPANFYSFDRVRAAEEVKYRKALREEIDKLGDKVSDLGH